MLKFHTRTRSPRGARAVARATKPLVESLESRSLLSTTFTLINADTDQAIRTIANGEVLDYAKLPTRNLTIRADVSSDVGAESVVFGLDGNARFKIESDEPYSIVGDDGLNYRPWTPSTGSHQLTLTPYTGNKATGNALASTTISFQVVDTATTPAPEPEPEPNPNPNPNPPTDPDDATYKSAFTITKGGTYSGNYQSLSASTPVITIATSEPVVIENAILRGKSHLIVVKDGVKANVTIRNVQGYGMNPDVDGKYPGRFLFANSFAKVDIQHNYMESTSGIYLFGAADGASVKVMYNEAKNIDGRMSAGPGKWRQPGTDSTKSDTSFYRVQFFQINQCVLDGGAEIAWNKVVNEAGKSRVEDNISIHRTKGTSSNPIRIHDNYIDGAYPLNWQTGKFSGGGIIVDGGWSDSRGEAGYVKIYNNTVISTSNYGIAIAAGHDSQIYNNRVVSTGKVDGTGVRSGNVGIYIRNHAYRNGKEPAGHFYNNYAYDNVVGWLKADGTHNEYYMPDDDGDKSVNNQKLSGSITEATEQAEYTRWLSKVDAANVMVGLA